MTQLKMNIGKQLNDLITLIQSLRIAENKEVQLDKINAALLEVGFSIPHAERVIISLKTFNERDFQFFQYQLDISPSILKQLEAIFWITNHPTSSSRLASSRRLRTQLEEQPKYYYRG